MLTDKPNIVYCDYKPKRTRKRRPQPEPACGRIIEIKPTKRQHHHYWERDGEAVRARFAEILKGLGS